MPKYKQGDKVVIVSQHGPNITHYHAIGEVCRILATGDGYYVLEASNHCYQSVEECCFKHLKPLVLENK